MPTPGLKTVGIFADIGSLYYYTVKKFPGRKLDYGVLYAKAAGDDALFKAIAYGSHVNDEAAKFITCLRKIGFETKYKRLETRRIEGTNETRAIRSTWNVQMTIDILSMLDKLNVVVICSSDLELLSLVEYIKSRGVTCQIISAGIPQKLREAADSYIDVDESYLEVLG